MKHTIHRDQEIPISFEGEQIGKFSTRWSALEIYRTNSGKVVTVIDEFNNYRTVDIFKNMDEFKTALSATAWFRFHEFAAQIGTALNISESI